MKRVYILVAACLLLVGCTYGDYILEFVCDYDINVPGTRLNISIEEGFYLRTEQDVVIQAEKTIQIAGKTLRLSGDTVVVFLPSSPGGTDMVKCSLWVDTITKTIRVKIPTYVQ